MDRFSSTVERFSKCLTAIEYPKEKCSWNIAGILKNRNAFYKFDVRDMEMLSSGEWVKKGNTKTKSDKMVFELKNTWLIIDVKELHDYLKITKTRVVKLEELEKCLEWNIKVSRP